MRILLALIAACTVAIIGLVVYSVIDFNNWNKACLATGGKVEERYEYTDMIESPIYDGNGNITSVIIVPVNIYSYHCWVNHEEIEVHS